MIRPHRRHLADAVAVPDPSGRFSGHPAAGGQIGQGFEPWYPTARHGVLLLRLLLVLLAVSTPFPFGPIPSYVPYVPFVPSRVSVAAFAVFVAVDLQTCDSAGRLIGGFLNDCLYNGGPSGMYSDDKASSTPGAPRSAIRCPQHADREEVGLIWPRIPGASYTGIPSCVWGVRPVGLNTAGRRI
jgi:hypothetical protein